MCVNASALSLLYRNSSVRECGLSESIPFRVHALCSMPYHNITTRIAIVRWHTHHLRSPIALIWTKRELSKIHPHQMFVDCYKTLLANIRRGKQAFTILPTLRVLKASFTITISSQSKSHRLCTFGPILNYPFSFERLNVRPSTYRTYSYVLLYTLFWL